MDVKEKGLTIGGFESTFFADLIAAYMLTNNVDQLLQAIFNGIYHDNGFLVFRRKKFTVDPK